MNESELLKKFLSGYPESFHPLDMKRFAAYAVACACNNVHFDGDSLRAHGLDEECVEAYESAFGWIREAYNILMDEGMIEP